MNSRRRVNFSTVRLLSFWSEVKINANNRCRSYSRKGLKMRKVKYGVANSLDNFIARKDGAYDWILTQGDHMKEISKFFKSFDAVLMGRKTYEVALSQGAGSGAYPGMKSYVFSRTLKECSDAGVKIVSENAGEFIRNLKNASGKDIWLMGGGNLAQTLFDENLIDEILLGVHPVLLGSGIPLFSPINHQIDLELTDCKTYKSGLVQLSYRVKK
jgi:dihydrofolate reductase